MRKTRGWLFIGLGFLSVAVPGQPLETGLGNRIYSDKIKGDFVVAGASSRIRQGVQTTDFTVAVAGIPMGATIVKAFANWSYLTNNATAANTILINDNPVTGQKSGEGARDLMWGFDKAAAYTADVTNLITGNGNLTIKGATDPSSGIRIGEGISIATIYRLDSLAEKEVNVYDGYTSTTTGDAFGTLNFARAYASDMKLFVNALDGQAIFSDDFYVNGRYASELPGLGGSANAWRGTLGPGGPGDNYYDHFVGDVSTFTNPNDMSITVETDGFDEPGPFTDAIGHSFAAVSFKPVPEPATLAVLGLGLAAFLRRRSRS